MASMGISKRSLREAVLVRCGESCNKHCIFLQQRHRSSKSVPSSSACWHSDPICTTTKGKIVLLFPTSADLCRLAVKTNPTRTGMALPTATASQESPASRLVTPAASWSSRPRPLPPASSVLGLVLALPRPSARTFRLRVVRRPQHSQSVDRLHRRLPRHRPCPRLLVGSGRAILAGKDDLAVVAAVVSARASVLVLLAVSRGITSIWMSRS